MEIFQHREQISTHGKFRRLRTKRILGDLGWLAIQAAPRRFMEILTWGGLT